jgi:hypothetical protein
MNCGVVELQSFRMAVEQESNVDGISGEHFCCDDRLAIGW